MVVESSLSRLKMERRLVRRRPVSVKMGCLTGFELDNSFGLQGEGIVETMAVGFKDD